MNLVKYRKLQRITLLLSAAQSHWEFLYLCHRAMKKKRSRVWTKIMYAEHERELNGFLTELFAAIKNNDVDKFRKATRMNVDTYMLLKRSIEKRIKKKDFIRESISPDCRLAATLVYLGHGACRKMLANLFRVGVSTMGCMIMETCEAIWDELSPTYLAPPTEEDWERIEVDFFEQTGVPHVVGAIDVRSVHVMAPPRAGYRPRGYISVDILAACDTDHNFTAVDIGICLGRQSDDGVHKLGGFGSTILAETINLPEARPLPNSKLEVPSFFVGDAAFPLKRNIMTPYSAKNPEIAEEHYNRTLSNVHGCIENSFGVLAARWRVLTNSLNMAPMNAERVIKASVVLHNFVKVHDAEDYCPENFVDRMTKEGELIEGKWREEVAPLVQGEIFTRFSDSQDAAVTRDVLKDFLSHRTP